MCVGSLQLAAEALAAKRVGHEVSAVRPWPRDAGEEDEKSVFLHQGESFALSPGNGVADQQDYQSDEKRGCSHSRFVGCPIPKCQGPKVSPRNFYNSQGSDLDA